MAISSLSQPVDLGHGEPSLDWLLGGYNHSPRWSSRLRENWPIMAGIAAVLLITVSVMMTPIFAGNANPVRVDIRRWLPAQGQAIDSPFAPQSLRKLTADQALQWNAKSPLSGVTNPAANGFSMASARGDDYTRSLQCLTQAVYYEAGSEGAAGEAAVAQVVLNRVRHPAYPNTVCGVIFQGASRATGCQFTFACDGSLARKPSEAGWQRAENVAASALAGYVYAPVGWATHYHADYVVPYWSATLLKVAQIGHHIFYRWDGASGGASAFRARYAGAEPDAANLAAQIGGDSGAVLPNEGPAVTVAAKDRPILFGGTDGEAAQGKSGAKPVPAPSIRAVSDNQRWIVAAGPTRAPAPPERSDRPVLVAGDAPAH